MQDRAKGCPLNPLDPYQITEEEQRDWTKNVEVLASKNCIGSERFWHLSVKAKPSDDQCHSVN